MKRYSYTWEDAVKRLPERTDNAHKGNCGKLFLIAGSKNMAGASFFAAKAAYRSGAGLVYIYAPEANRVILQQMIPEAVLITYPDEMPDAEEVRHLMKGKQAVAIGPGIGDYDIWKDVIGSVLQSGLPVVMDADALNVSARLLLLQDVRNCELVITPHPLEMARLCGCDIAQVTEKLEETAVRFSKEHAVTVVLKDHHTVVTDGNEIYRNLTGNYGMATGGSGDVLTGVLGSLLAQKMPAFEAAKLAVCLHGKAGDDAAEVYGKRALMAGDIADYLMRGL